jgi:uncharacterized protein involved in cysteine biosynthesis
LRLVWERKKRGIIYYLVGIPIVILLVIVNIVLITWFLHLLYALFTDSPKTMSLPEWAEYLCKMIKHLIDLLILLGR